jgi:hypothetical protein
MYVLKYTGRNLYYNNTRMYIILYKITFLNIFDTKLFIISITIYVFQLMILPLKIDEAFYALHSYYVHCVFYYYCFAFYLTNHTTTTIYFPVYVSILLWYKS